MIDYEIKAALENLTGLPAYPLLLPNTEQEGITYQKISDSKVNTGLANTALIQGLFQLSLFIIDDYARLIELDNRIVTAWESITHGQIGSWPVQHVSRGITHQDVINLTNSQKQYRLIRDYRIYYPEVNHDQY